jgi:hypothetical protein
MIFCLVGWGYAPMGCKRMGFPLQQSVKFKQIQTMSNIPAASGQGAPLPRPGLG